jgi:stalled ribosome rescue protein Dom34
MSIQAGVWIDRKRAIVVLLDDDLTEEIYSLESGVESHTRASGGSTSGAANGPHDVVAEDKVQRRFTQHLNTYYRKVAASLCDVDSLFILGPGEAKMEFKKQIRNRELLSRIAAVETSDKLTERQLAAKVREFFATIASK